LHFPAAIQSNPYLALKRKVAAPPPESHRRLSREAVSVSV
jgi:hypothetical protein